MTCSRSSRSRPNSPAPARCRREVPRRRAVAPRAVRWLAAAGSDAVHTLDLPDGNRATDARVTALADAEQRVVVTKDADFVGSHTLHGRPAKLLLVSTGNMSNADLEALMVPLIPLIVREFRDNFLLELRRTGVVVRG